MFEKIVCQVKSNRFPYCSTFKNNVRHIYHKDTYADIYISRKNVVVLAHIIGWEKKWDLRCIVIQKH